MTAARRMPRQRRAFPILNKAYMLRAWPIVYVPRSARRHIEYAFDDEHAETTDLPTTGCNLYRA